MSTAHLYPFLLTVRPRYDETELVARFTKHLKALRYVDPTKEDILQVLADREALQISRGLTVRAAAALIPFPATMPDGIHLRSEDKARIKRRARCLAWGEKGSVDAFCNLKKEEADRLKPIEAGLPAVLPGNEHWADEIAAHLHDEMPWMGRATEHAWHALRRSARLGEPIRLRPFILNGPWGIGKSAWARRLSERLGTPSVEIDASKGGAGFALVGVERGWGTAQPGRPVEVILEHRVINPICIIDEICKAKAMTSNKGTRHNFSDALLSLLEPETAGHWECPNFRLSFDMSRISWILTSNLVGTIPPAVLSRCQVIELPDLAPNDLVHFARRQGSAMGLSQPSIDAVMEAAVRGPALARRRFSLRDITRLLERAETLQSKPLLH